MEFLQNTIILFVQRRISIYNKLEIEIKANILNLNKKRERQTKIKKTYDQMKSCGLKNLNTTRMKATMHI
jgi:hypothetical protein